MTRHHDDHDHHPVAVAVRAASSELTAVTDTPVWSMTGAGVAATLSDLVALRAQVAEAEARLLAQAETLELHRDTGAKSMGQWYARHTRLTRSEAYRRVRLAKALGAHDATRMAMARGEVHAEQALAVTAAVDELSEQQDLAEKHLLGEAADHDADALRRLGRRILEVVDPERADEHEARLLAEQEARAAKRTRFTMRDDGEGCAHGRFTIPSAQGAMLRKALNALAAPKHVRATDGAGSYDWEKPTAEKLGKAFCEYVERYPTDRLPNQGGISAAVVVKMDLATLLGHLKAAHLDTGHAISPGLARRLACEAGLIPAILGSKSQVLDLGRRTRLHTTAQRLALTIQQTTCQHPACDTAAAFCHVHHDTPWSRGGNTDLANGVLLCPFHHHQAHRPDDRNHPSRT